MICIFPVKSLLAALLALTAMPALAAPFVPRTILAGGEVIPLYPPDSPMLRKDRLAEAEVYNSQGGGDGPVTNVINIHNPSIEVHLAPNDETNTGTAVIIAPGGGHKILWVGPEGADWVPFFAKAGVSTIILRNRLRVDGYEPTTDAVNDAFQAIRIVRSRAADWRLDPAKIGIVGFSAGAELSAPAAMFYEDFQKANQVSDLLAGISPRPDFVGVIYPGPTPFTRNPAAPIPADVPPSFIACAGSGDQIHALWATDYFTPMLLAGVPNLEMHIYGRGGHAVRPDAPIPYATWGDRFMDWFRDLGFLGEPGEETRAARDVARRADPN